MKKNIYIKNFLTMVKIAWQQNRYFIIWQLLINTIRGPFPLIVAYINKIIIDKITNNKMYAEEGKFINFFYLVVITIAVQFFYEFLMTLDTKLAIVSSNNIFVKFEETILKKIKELDKEHFEKVRSKDIVYRGVNFNYEIVHSLVDSISTIFRRLFTALVAAVILFNYSYVLTIVVILMCVPNLIIGKIIAKKNIELTEKLTILSRKKEYFANVLKTKNYIKEIRLYNTNTFFKDKYLVASREHIKLNKKYVICNLLLNGIIDFLQTIISGSVYGYLILSAYNHRSTIGDINFVKSAFDNLNTELYSSLSMVIKLYKDISSFNFFNQFLELENKINQHKDIYLEMETKGDVKIEFRNVYFSYPESDTYSLENVSFIIEKGETVGLVGINGSGKSTVIKLLLRMYDCNKGKILINDIDIKLINPFSYRSLWGVQHQNYYIYPLSVAENIALGEIEDKIEYTKLIDALEKSDSIQFIQKMEQGVYTPLYKTFSYSGYEPSGGEKQKISLARLFYKEFNLFILDEPSSSIDAEAENIIFNKIDKMICDKTTIFVTHRLSNLKLCNKIILLHNGKVVEIGTHKQLLKNSLFSKLYYTQANRYK